MKISIGTKIRKGPWGGGNLFAINLKNYLERNGHKVLNDLSEDDIDIILLTEPRKTSESSSFTHVDVLKYVTCVNNNSLVIHRINECDERKGTNFVNKFLIEANQVSDATIFVSTWLKNLFFRQQINQDNCHVILSGANKDIFNNKNFIPWDGINKLNIVTHHWGANWNKGFDIYSELDQLLSDTKYSERISFTYIGNVPKGFKFKNTRQVNPLEGNDLANEIKKSNLYLTASLNEPSGNHHIEAAQCGLPLLYIDSGGIPEYCEGFGISFNKSNFESKLNEMIEDYKIYVNNIGEYSLNSEKMSKNYENLFNDMLSNKDDVINRRKKLKLNIVERFLYKISRRIDKFFNAIYLKYFDSKFD